jgi:hypothetical protein
MDTAQFIKKIKQVGYFRCETQKRVFYFCPDETSHTCGYVLNKPTECQIYAQEWKREPWMKRRWLLRKTEIQNKSI